MAEKRRMTLAVTVFVTADLSTTDDNTHVSVVSAEHNILGSVLPVGEVTETTEPWRARMGMEGTKLALQYVLDKLEGKLDEAVPVLSQPGADA